MGKLTKSSPSYKAVLEAMLPILPATAAEVQAVAGYSLDTVNQAIVVAINEGEIHVGELIYHELTGRPTRVLHVGKGENVVPKQHPPRERRKVSRKPVEPEQLKEGFAWLGLNL